MVASFLMMSLLMETFLLPMSVAATFFPIVSISSVELSNSSSMMSIKAISSCSDYLNLLNSCSSWPITTKAKIANSTKKTRIFIHLIVVIVLATIYTLIC